MVDLLGKRVVLLFAIFAFAGSAIGENYVRNGTFSEWNGSSPKGWRFGSSGKGTLSYDTDDKPEGLAGSLRVDIEGSGSGQGQVIQKFKIPAESVLYLEGWIKSGKSEKGFLQIKLYKGGKEQGRISVREPGSGWNRIQKEFSVGNADQIGLLLRYNQSSGNIGKSVWFAGMSVIPASERVRELPSIAKLEGRPTFNSIGVYADIGGDMSRFTKGNIVYREAGESEWKPGLDVIWQDKTKQMRTSLLNLEEDTEYEFKLSLSDPNLDEEIAPVTGSARTWSSEVPIAKTITLPSGVTTEPLIVTESGTAEGWIRYTGHPDGTTVLDAGKNGPNAIKLVDVHHVVIDNLKVVGGIKDAILVSNSTDIRIRRSDISGWGQVGTLSPSTNKKWGKGPFYLDDEGNRINLEGGVRLSKGAERVVIEDNFIHHPRGQATSWKNGHPLGPTAIILFNSNGHHVIRNNELVGGENHRFNDTIEGAYNSYITGGPHRDTDISGNVMFFSNDDGIELDGGQMNVRFFNNWIQSSYCGVSTAPTLLGPSYIYRNLIVLEGEERGATNFALKVGGNRGGEPGPNFFYHNTIWSNGKALRGGNWGKGPMPITTRNNLIAAGELLWPQKAMADFDYDMLRPNSIDPPLAGWEVNGVIGIEKFTNKDEGNYGLTENSPAIGKGEPLPMVNDSKNPDIGAIPYGSDALFPKRTSGISLLPMQVNLSGKLGDQQSEAVELQVMVPRESGTEWTLISDSPWLRIEPRSGKATGKAQTVRVWVDLASLGDDEGLKQTAITVRTDKGLNRTSFVKAIVEPAQLNRQVFKIADLKQQGFDLVESDPNAPVVPYLQAPPSRAEAGKASIEIDFEIKQAGVYYLHGLIEVPGPGAPGHDSCFVEVDGAEPFYWPFNVTAPGIWAWQVANWQKNEYPKAMHFDAGQHKIIVRGRESLTRFAGFVISQSSIPSTIVESGSSTSE
tara:strand:+ start:7797 stop:10676 length:2880 start_codon:yes stop_codon:yes gene_type:complete